MFRPYTKALKHVIGKISEVIAGLSEVNMPKTCFTEEYNNFGSNTPFCGCRSKESVLVLD